MIEKAKNSIKEVIQIGEDREIDQRDIPIHIIVEPNRNLQLIQEEIFGPIIPILTQKNSVVLFISGILVGIH